MGLLDCGEQQKHMKEFVACNANSNNGKMFTPDEWISIELIVCKNTITNEDRNIWRKEFRPSDPPAQTPPFTIKLKPNVIPYIAKARKYNDEEIRFLNLWNKKLIDGGLAFYNHQSRWASRVLPVKKRTDDILVDVSSSNGKMSKPLKSDEALLKLYRETTDYVVVNSKCVPLAGQMPFQDVALEMAAGCKYFGVFDFVSGFNQIGNSKETAEILSSRTPGGIVTKSRMPMGHCDSGLYFQAMVEECLKSLLGTNLAIWIDDIILYAKTAVEYIRVLGQMLDLLEAKGWKLSLKKSHLCQTEIKWCGRIISADGVRHDPVRMQALNDMRYPENAGELMQFLCSAGWMRYSIIDFARISKPLNQKLNKATEGKKKSKRAASAVKLEFTNEDKHNFDQLKDAIMHSIALSFPIPESNMCLFTDASDLGWAIIITQVLKWDKSKLAHEQEHHMLHCQSGTFSGAQLNWSIVEKECYPVAKACADLDHMLMRPQGFTIYCDHRNLVHMFAPSQDIKKHIRGKLLRWGLQIAQYRYILEHVPGETNVVADLFSRWGGPTAVIKKHAMTSQHLPAVVSKTKFEVKPCHMKQLRRFLKRFTRRQNRDTQQSQKKSRFMSTVQMDLHPLDTLSWPSVEEIKDAQDESCDSRPAQLRRGNQELWMDGDRAWIPPSATELIVRLMILAHCGHMGHRGQTTTKLVLNTVFWIPGLDAKLKNFLDACLLCPHVKGGRVIPRPWSAGIQTTVPNLYLHMDYLYIGDSNDNYKYILVLKDAASHMVRFVPCVVPTAEVTAKALMQWCSDYGTPKYLVSDQGSHFKNETIQLMTEMRQVEHQFIVAYSPWKNGTVERVNRDILQLSKTMLMEFGWNHKEWPRLLELLQHNINHSPVASLANHAPIEVFSSHKPDNPLRTCIDPNGNNVELVYSGTIEERLEAAQNSLRAIHLQVEKINIRQQLLNMEQQRVSQEVNFEIGDYVLRSRVDDKLQDDKLNVTWVGPYHVVEAHQHQAFTVQHLITKKQRRVHASRLKFYHDESLNISEQWLSHIATQNELLQVSQLHSSRWNRNLEDFEILIQWDGLEPEENSWEPVLKLRADIPKMLETFAEDKPDLKAYLSKLNKTQEAAAAAKVIAKTSGKRQRSSSVSGAVKKTRHTARRAP